LHDPTSAPRVLLLLLFPLSKPTTTVLGDSVFTLVTGHVVDLSVRHVNVARGAGNSLLELRLEASCR